MQKKHIVLGSKCGGEPQGNGHDCNVCLMSNKKIIAIQAERIDRIKKSSGWKKNTSNWWNKDRESLEFEGCGPSIRYCLDYCDIQTSEIDLIVVDDLGDIKSQVSEIKETIPDIPRIERISHHLAHASSAFFCSGFDSAAILIIDGGGGKQVKNGKSVIERQSFYIGSDINIEHIHTTWSSQENIWGLGGAYAIHQKILNMEAGKVMGLAAYGSLNNDYNFPIFKQLNDFDILMNDFITNDKDIENPVITSSNTMYKMVRDWDIDPVENKWADIAFKIQNELENSIIKLANHLYKKTKQKKLCLAGGVALNSVANQKIIDNSPFEEVFIQPASDDGGIGLGCALFGYHQILKNDRNYILKNAYLGKVYTDDEILEGIELNKEYIKYTVLENCPREVASLLKEKKIIAWFQGASEYGPRALGHRSLLCDPTDIELKNKMNLEVKSREWWRPLAPSILLEFVNQYFEIESSSPFMLLVGKVRKEKLMIIPGVTHIDQTARIQTVTKEDNDIYYELVSEFYKQTGVPVLLNTSFNLRNEPIVESPIDAISTFLRAEKIDSLIIGKYKVDRK